MMNLRALLKYKHCTYPGGRGSNERGVVFAPGSLLEAIPLKVFPDNGGELVVTQARGIEYNVL